MFKSGNLWGEIMFMGEYRHSIDAKGRIIMPAKFREDIGEKFIVTKGLDGCLFAFSLEEWKIFEQKLRALPISNKDARAFSRFFFAGAIDCELDKQGRFLISSNLREFAEFVKDAVIVGMDSRIEIWAKEKWENTDNNISADEIAAKMEMLGI